jgi:hypothetical protein
MNIKFYISQIRGDLNKRLSEYLRVQVHFLLLYPLHTFKDYFRDLYATLVLAVVKSEKSLCSQGYLIVRLVKRKVIE